MRQRTHFGMRRTIQEGRKRAKKIKFFLRSSFQVSRTFKGPGEDGEEEEENSVEEEELDGTEGIPAPVGTSFGTGGPTIAQSLLTFKTPYVKESECFNETQSFKARSFIQSCQLVFHNDMANFSQERKKFLYSTSFLIGRAEKLIEPYISYLTNQDPSYLISSWNLFEAELVTLVGDPNEVRKAEAELDCLRRRKGGHVSLYITNFKSFVSGIGDWGEKALIHHFRKGFPSRIQDQLASNLSKIDSLQDLIDITLEFDTRYHERQKEKSHHQEKNPEASKSNSSHPQSYSS
ncbi:hypothetical protein O181_071459 [Austropuccinia psidii MF-1]|uniref:Retrotransposon gag domain-containing protein n=1 Tax=Austropuccinia psidii MF-1 TaxID=1389203 RepID=A0A9Q3IAI3_9BASI|nr:hypothetical protein [Austropuccinia psidii MF-1]